MASYSYFRTPSRIALAWVQSRARRAEQYPQVVGHGRAGREPERAEEQQADGVGARCAARDRCFHVPRHLHGEHPRAAGRRCTITITITITVQPSTPYLGQ